MAMTTPKNIDSSRINVKMVGIIYDFYDFYDIFGDELMWWKKVETRKEVLFSVHPQFSHPNGL